MDINVQIPFQQLLDIVKSLPSAQKAKLRQELDEKKSASKNQDDFIDYLLNGPVYTSEEIQVIEETRKSISEWRTAS